MTIPYFAASQNTVFIPAFASLLVATIALCLPIMFGAGLRRHGRTVPAWVAAVMVALVGIVGTVFLAIPAFGTLGGEREHVRTVLAERYGAHITLAQAGEMVNGGKPLLKDTALAARVGLTPPTTKPWNGYTLRLVATSLGADTYTVEYGEKPLKPLG